ncbi:MAG TPA: outer membrane beta-barrel protein [Gemmatimonadaceae bacterium]|jgi:hypothetical protein
MRALRFAVTSLLLSLAAPRARAQSAQAFSVQASALYSGLQGSSYAGLSAGPGYEVQFRYTTTVGLSLGAGYQRTTHDITNASGSASLAGPFIEPRYAFVIASQERLFPYVALRAAFLKQDASDVSFHTTASGISAGIGGGLLIPVGGHVNLDVGATFGIARFGNFVVTDPATGQRVGEGSTGTGSNYVLRAGLALGLF